MSTPERPVEPALFTLPECAERLRVSVSTIRRMIARKELLAIKLHDGPNAPMRVLSSSVRVYLAQRVRAAGHSS